ncbi:MAG: spermidine synthase [Deltaproteobacteria bacterium]|nr:spermidine synthase [Candidatus Zymogenaceae bacterium]
MIVNGNKAPRPCVIESLEGVSGDLILFSRETPEGPRYEITIGGHFVMAASDGPTERRLASAALGLLNKDADIAVLVGGLGLGLTLAQTLADRRVGRVVVAELEQAVIRWNRTHLKEFNARALFDNRVTVWEGDVLELIEKRRGAFDAVLMDVDNGPSFLILERNAPLYTRRGMKKIRRCLAQGGVLGVWSSQPDDRLEAVLTEVFGDFGRELITDKNLREDLPPTAVYTAVKR